MRLRRIALFPVLFAGAFAAAALLAGDAHFAQVLAAQNVAGKVVAAVGCLAAAVAFESGDYMRRAWLYAGICYAMLLGADVTRTTWAHAAFSVGTAELLRGVLAVIANALSVVGTWMLAHAWTVSGLDEGDDEARTRRRRLLLAAVALSLAITGWPLLHDARTLLGGDTGALADVASDMGDMICLALVAPVMQTALAMRGGVLRWPWGLLAASGLSWLVYDAATGVGGAVHVDGALGQTVIELWRALACAATFAAGLAQRRVVSGPPESAPAA